MNEWVFEGVWYNLFSSKIWCTNNKTDFSRDIWVRYLKSKDPPSSVMSIFWCPKQPVVVTKLSLWHIMNRHKDRPWHLKRRSLQPKWCMCRMKEVEDQLIAKMWITGWLSSSPRKAARVTYIFLIGGNEDFMTVKSSRRLKSSGKKTNEDILQQFKKLEAANSSNKDDTVQTGEEQVYSFSHLWK